MCPAKQIALTPPSPARISATNTNAIANFPPIPENPSGAVLASIPKKGSHPVA